MLRSLSFSSTSLSSQFGALDAAVDQFSETNHPTGTDTHEAQQLYLVLSVHTFADLCHALEQPWSKLSTRDKRAVEDDMRGVMGLLPGLKAGEWPLRWRAFVTKSTAVRSLAVLVSQHDLPLAPSDPFPNGRRLASGIRSLARSFLEGHMSALQRAPRDGMADDVYESVLDWCDRLCDLLADPSLNSTNAAARAEITAAVGVCIFKVGVLIKHARRTGSQVELSLVRSTLPPPILACSVNQLTQLHASAGRLRGAGPHLRGSRHQFETAQGAEHRVRVARARQCCWLEPVDGQARPVRAGAEAGARCGCTYIACDFAVDGAACHGTWLFQFWRLGALHYSDRRVVRVVALACAERPGMPPVASLAKRGDAVTAALRGIGVTASCPSAPHSRMANTPSAGFPSWPFVG